MNVYVKTYPAKKGDSFLVSFGATNDKEKHLLIDCGFVDTFQTYIKNDLLEINKKGEVIEKLIITHIDADHIRGAIELLQENNAKKFIEIKQIWHNTFRHFFEEKDNEIDKKQERLLKQIIRRGYPADEHRSNERMISAHQGTTVGALILQGEYPWNSDFENQVISIEKKIEIKIDEEASIFLLSPDKQKLKKMKELWEEELKRYGVNYSSGNSQFYDDAYEMLLLWEKQKSNIQTGEISATKESIDELLKRPFDEDSTATNGSSIAFIIKIQAKQLLFLSDAHPDLIIKSLNAYQNQRVIIFNLIKISHHGSFNNINQELLNMIDSDKFLISTNGGKHNHPDKETIAHIISRKVDFHRKLYFNYITVNSEYFNRIDWMKTYNYSIHYLNKAPYTLPI